jgi:uncharacterized protein (TIGR04255 family)
MPFPESPRVRYGKNPLVEVVCQLKFPTILRIDAEPPVAFQEKIRHLFPEYRPTQPQLPAGVRLPLEVLQMMFGGMGGGSHEFLAGDEKSRVTLTRDFVALTTSDYSEWKTFSEMLAIPLTALANVYKPPYFSRVGLRYRDQIDRKSLGLEAVAWSELLRDEVAGELAHGDVAPDVVRIIREVGLTMPNESGNIRIVHGLEGDGSDPTYMIDADFFIERKIEHGETNDVLEVFNRTAGNLFRWCVKRRLHDAMEPRVP